MTSGNNSISGKFNLPAFWSKPTLKSSKSEESAPSAPVKIVDSDRVSRKSLDLQSPYAALGVSFSKPTAPQLTLPTQDFCTANVAKKDIIESASNVALLKGEDLPTVIGTYPHIVLGTDVASVREHAEASLKEFEKIIG